MCSQVADALTQLGTLHRPIGWVTVALFLCAIVLDSVDRTYARPVYVFAWCLFSVFWLVLIYPYFAIENSLVEGTGSVLAVVLSLLIARVIYSGSDQLFTMSRAIPLMGLFYAPFVALDTLREQMILVVVNHTSFAMNLIGYDPPVVTELSEAAPYVPTGLNPNLERTITAKEYAFENTFVFFTDGGGTITYTIVLMCTGVGSMAVIVGLVLAVEAPLRRKVKALSVALPIIYVLNIVRNVFIGINFGHQYAHIAPDLTMALFALDNELQVSYIWADRIAAQGASVIAMVAIFWLVVKIVPEVMEPVEEVLYLLTGEELDLAAAMNVDRESSDSAEFSD
jgi:archaeosortase A (PGF-CTERM-specific)